jgi:uncharacterized protein YggE
MKTRVTVVLVVLAILNTVPALSQQVYDNRHIISVNGEALVYAIPDKIIVALGIETRDPDIMVSKQRNNEILKKTLAVIRELGIPEKEIQTDHVSVEPRYTDNYRKEDFIGYFVRNSLVVTLGDTGKIEELVTKALQAGVNYIHGVDFQTTEFKRYREQARELALKAAKEKAEKMASVLGQSVGDPLRISENYTGSFGPYYSGWSGWGFSRGQSMSQNAIQNVQGGSSEISETIALGKISIRASVAIIFELKK